MAQQKALVIIDIQKDYFENGSLPLVDSEAASVKAKSFVAGLSYFYATIITADDYINQ